MTYQAPSVSKKAFNCPHCNVLTSQTHYTVLASVASPAVRDIVAAAMGGAEVRERLMVLDNVGDRRCRTVDGLRLSQCYHCSEVCVWIKHDLVYPDFGDAPQPNNDLSEEIKQDYVEASSILDNSPRGAAALLRLCIQKLCKELGQPGKNINSDIGALVAAGLDARVQKALDAVRVIGNEAVHPGTMALQDDRETAETLFRLVNYIAEKMISEPRRVDEIFDTLPETKKAEIARRDGLKGLQSAAADPR